MTNTSPNVWQTTLLKYSHNPATYRALIKYMRDFNIIHHTYQPKDEKAYRIVLKYVHHSVHTPDITAEFEAK